MKPKRITLSRVTDHIVPHKGDMVLFWDRTNWQGSCKHCHDIKTSTEDGGFGNMKGKGKARADCGVDGVPTDSRSHWNK
jgi:5-methylcytosine-specific restriction protein A